MRLALAPRWILGSEALDARVIPLLRAVAREGSLHRAISTVRISYRHAWGLLGKAERAAGQPLVLLERGRGARLSPLAEELLSADAAAADSLTREMTPTVTALNNMLGAGRKPRSSADRIVVHASHDYALAELKEMLVSSDMDKLELRFRGSLECLADLSRKECDIAGFHVPAGPTESKDLDPFRSLLKSRRMTLVRFVDRVQGLIVARGNPKGVASIADLASNGIKFVNRQPNSGTRLALDRLLAQARILPARINGYRLEEFTHAAVAATVASGMADAGFGIEAAARQHRLDFVPVARERYFLAMRESTFARAPVQDLLALIGGTEFRRRLARLPGYDATGIGARIAVRDWLRAEASPD